MTNPDAVETESTAERHPLAGIAEAGRADRLRAARVGGRYRHPRRRHRLLTGLLVITLAGVGGWRVWNWAMPPVGPDDPAGDLAKLQGRWKRRTAPSFSHPRYESHVVFEGNILTHDPIGFREWRKPEESDSGTPKSRFIVKSAGRPKVIWITHVYDRERWIPVKHRSQWADGLKGPDHNWRYELDGDTLTTWTYWTEQGEHGYVIYDRLSRP